MTKPVLIVRSQSFIGGVRQTRWSNKQKAAKRCPSCGEPATLHVLCNECHAFQLARMQARRAA